MAKTDDFVTDDEMARMRQAVIDHPATKYTSAGGWCKRCGCGNDVLGHKHLPSCSRPADNPAPECNTPIERTKNRCTRDAGHPGPHRCLAIDVDQRRATT